MRNETIAVDIYVERDPLDYRNPDPAEAVRLAAMQAGITAEVKAERR